MFSCILLSAGKGTRVGNSTPKQYLPVAGKPMIVHTLERLDAIDMIDEIVVVCEDMYVDTIKRYLLQYGIRKKTVFVSGGATRQESVYNGLKAVVNSQVMIHESARPFVRKEDFENLLRTPGENVTFTYPIPYTVLKKNDDDEIDGILERKELVNIQLPQKFNVADLLWCHEQAQKDGKMFTEDAAMIYYYLDKKVYCLTGMEFNIKITEHMDLLYGEVIYAEEFARR